MKRTRKRLRAETPPPPTVRDLLDAPELAAIFLLEHALALASDALVAEHMTLIDDFYRPADQGAVVSLAHLICKREAALRHTLRRYRRAVRDATMTTASPEPDPDDEMF